MNTNENSIHDRFLELVPKGGFVLDAGCGMPGRSKCVVVE